MWELIANKKIPPTRIARYCCANLKEVSRAKGGYTLTGVRHAESVRRAGRESFEINGKTRKESVYNSKYPSDDSINPLPLPNKRYFQSFKRKTDCQQKVLQKR